MEIHVETRLLLYYVQTLSTLIGRFIPKLTDDRDDTDSDIININLTCVVKCHVKSCFRTVNVLRTKQSFKCEMRNAKTIGQFSPFFVTISSNMHLKKMIYTSVCLLSFL